MEPFTETLAAGRVTPAAAHRFRRHLYRFFHDQGRQLPPGRPPRGQARTALRRSATVEK